MVHWHFEPSIILGLALLLGGYLLGVGPLRRRYDGADRVARGQVLSFVLGALVIYIALSPPLHDLAERYLFSAHMVQHELLILLVPPLLLLGTPGWLLRPLMVRPRVWPVARTLVQPLAAFAVYNVVFAAWHYPPLYEGALREHNLHIFEHLTFLAAGVVLWWPVLSPLEELPRLPLLGQAGYLLAQMFPCSAVGALITLSGEVLYPWYAEAPRVWDISPLVDQQIGGVLMWAGGNAFFMVAAVVVFFLWAGREQAREAGGLPSPSR